MSISDEAVMLRCKGYRYARIAALLGISENSARVLVWKRRHPEANAALARDWYSSNPEKAKEAKRRYLAKKRRDAQ
jgi:uncharacterized protein YjcR